MKRLIAICLRKNDIPVSKRTLAVVMALLLVVTQQGLANIIYNDGGIHNISTAMPAGTVEIYSGSTVNVLSGGSINGGNQMWAYGIDTYDGFLNIYDGSVSGGVGTWVDGIKSNLSSSVTNIYGGSITGGSGDYAYGIRVYDGLVNVYGGTIAGGTGTFNYGLQVLGGTVNIYGSGFNYALGPISANLGTLTGTLSNGDPLSVTFARYDPGSIVLVPEPATICLLGLGALSLLRRKK